MRMLVAPAVVQTNPHVLVEMISHNAQLLSTAVRPVTEMQHLRQPNGGSFIIIHSVPKALNVEIRKSYIM